MDVSIIIVNYNTKDLTLDCLKSIYHFTENIKFEVILVDNNSHDDSVEFIRNFFPQVRLIESTENLGFGRANNLGFNYACGKYIFLLNSDTYLLNNAIKIFYDYMETCKKNIACVGTMLTDKNGFVVHSYGKYIRISILMKNIVRTIFQIPTPYLDVSQKSFPLEVEVIIGADLFIRRSVIDELGFFDPRFFMYHEENDLQKRYGDAGYKKVILTEPTIVHLEGKSSKKFNTLIRESTFIYLKKWNNWAIYYLYRIIYALGHSFIIFKRSMPWSDRKKSFAVCFYNVKKN